MKLEFGYGRGKQQAEISERNLLGILKPNVIRAERSQEDEVQYALEHPIGSSMLNDIVKPGEKIVLITSDITRPMPSQLVLTLLIRQMYDAGIAPEDITVVFALGSHRKQTDQEKRSLVGDQIFDQISCIDADPEDCICMGRTSRGTPVDIFRPVAKADRRICLGNIEYHYFAGYSGGAKAIMPGVSTREAIQANHRMMIEECAAAGKIIGNPIREDIDEAGKICGIDFIVNVILDEHKYILKAVAGDFIKAHRAGCVFIDQIYRCSIPRKADIVLVSQGGMPKDLNLYQTQKALDNAVQAVRQGGIIILIGSCLEGMGEPVFEEWMISAKEPDDLISRIHREFKLGGHKAAAIAMTLKKAEICLVSELDPSFVQRIFMTPMGETQKALDYAFQKLGKDATVLAMPYGGSTLPYITP